MEGQIYRLAVEDIAEELENAAREYHTQFCLCTKIISFNPHLAEVFLLLEGINRIIRASDGIYSILCGGQNDAGITKATFYCLVDSSIFHNKSNTED